MIIDPGTSSVVTSSSCLLEPLLDIFWARRIHRIFLLSRCRERNRFFMALQEFVVHFKRGKNLWLTLLFTLQKVTMVRKHFKLTLQKTLLQIDDSCYVYVNAKQYYLASFSICNSTLNASLRWPIRMRDFINYAILVLIHSHLVLNCVPGPKPKLTLSNWAFKTGCNIFLFQVWTNQKYCETIIIHCAPWVFG